MFTGIKNPAVYVKCLIWEMDRTYIQEKTKAKLFEFFLLFFILIRYYIPFSLTPSPVSPLDAMMSKFEKLTSGGHLL